MHAYLIIGNNQELVEKEIEKIRRTKNATVSEVAVSGIEDVRLLQELTKLKSAHPSIYVIPNVDKLSVPASNSFLKTLEEPRGNVTFILTATSSNILPTVVSRCTIIRTHPMAPKLENSNLENFWENPLDTQIKIISTIKKRDDAINFVKDLLIISHKELINNPSKIISSRVGVLEETLNRLNNNGNSTIQLTNCIIKCKALE